MLPDAGGEKRFTARCYCGRFKLALRGTALTVTYCHCADCRRWTGAPVAAFAAFKSKDFAATPPVGNPLVHAPGVERWNCQECGSPLAAQFDYLPGQVYVPLGLVDQAADLPPQIHCHDDARLPWLHIDDKLSREGGSARAALSSAT